MKGHDLNIFELNHTCNKVSTTKSPTIARKCWPYCLCLKPRLQFPVTKRKRFVRG